MTINPEPQKASWLSRLLKKFTPVHRDIYDFSPAHLALEERPPSIFARITAIGITFGVLLTLLWAYFGELDINATATGKLIVSSRTQTIQAYEQGRVTAIHVKDGQQVGQGEPLLTLNTVGVSQDIERLYAQADYQKQEVIRYQALLKEQPLQNIQYFPEMDQVQQILIKEHIEVSLLEYQSYLAKLDGDIAVNRSTQSHVESDLYELKKLLDNIRIRTDAVEKLHNKAMYGEIPLLEQKKEYLITQREFKQLSSQLVIYKAQLEVLNNEKAAYIAQRRKEWSDKLSQAKTALITTEEELKKSIERDGLMTIYAPLDGTVQQMVVHTIGGVVQPAQALMLIVPNDDVQLAELKVLNKDAGFIAPNQEVTLKIDTYPYTRYGTISAKVKHISRDSTEDEHLGLIFSAHIELLKNHIKVDGEQVLLTPGMSVVAEIKTGKRKVIDYILSPIREYQSEAMREK